MLVKCMCGSVKYEIEGAIGAVNLCHCTHCREATDSAFSANTKLQCDQFKLITGVEALCEYEHVPVPEGFSVQDAALKYTYC